MIDIVGNIKIDESRPERIAYLVASMRSLHFLKDHSKFVLNLTTPSEELYRIVTKELKPFKNVFLSMSPAEKSYGEKYSILLRQCRQNFVLNFLEDHFTVVDHVEEMWHMIANMHGCGADIMKASFWPIEQNSSMDINLQRSPYQHEKIFKNTFENHQAYCKHYGSRFYIGVNFITTRAFALKFWNRHLGPRPHDYEIANHSPEWEHTCMVPYQEIQCAIDDDHGEPGTCLLKRQEPKWLRIYEEVCRELGLQPNSELPTPNSSLS